MTDDPEFISKADEVQETKAIAYEIDGNVTIIQKPQKLVIEYWDDSARYGGYILVEYESKEKLEFDFELELEDWISKGWLIRDIENYPLIVKLSQYGLPIMEQFSIDNLPNEHGTIASRTKIYPLGVMDIDDWFECKKVKL